MLRVVEAGLDVGDVVACVDVGYVEVVVLFGVELCVDVEFCSSWSRCWWYSGSTVASSRSCR